MRFVLTVTMPHEPFNSLVRDGSAGEKISSILSDLNPEAVYFTELDGTRCGILVINLDDVSEIPKYAEPFFLTFNADCEFRVAMTPEDLGRAGLGELARIMQEP